MSPIPINTFNYKGIEVSMLRLDEAHTNLQGNKFYKLKYNLEAAKLSGYSSLLTFAGAFSNHLHAVATAGKLLGFNTIGIIRGEDDPNNPTLKYVREKGMQLKFISREQYRQFRDEQHLLDTLTQEFGKYYFLPEGGTNHLAVKGCAEILADIHQDYTHIFCSVGTGGTLAGLISTPHITGKIIGITALKSVEAIKKNIAELIDPNATTSWEICDEYHFGGFAKYHPELIQFINHFQSQYHIQLDPIYTCKMMFAIFDKIEKEKITPSHKILCIHTGGLQGWSGWHHRFPPK